jgi:hypothetical protein
VVEEEYLVEEEEEEEELLLVACACNLSKETSRGDGALEAGAMMIPAQIRPP